MVGTLESWVGGIRSRLQGLGSEQEQAMDSPVGIWGSLASIRMIDTRILNSTSSMVLLGLQYLILS